MEDMCGGNNSLSDIVSVLWVDDEDRTVDAKNLSSESLSIEWQHPEALETKLKEYEGAKNTIPDLFLIDFYLGQKESVNGEKYTHSGLTSSALIREKYPEYPIYLVTAEETGNGDANLSIWSQAAECTFDYILTLKKIQREGKNILYYDALDFKVIRSKTPRGDIQALFDLLKVPTSVKEKIKLILPDELKSGLVPETNINPEGNVISFTRWVRGSLFANPGLLYNKLYTATLLGVNFKGFDRISQKFRKALYTGIFSKTTEPKWWASELNDVVFSYKKAQQIKSSDTWVVSTTIFSIPEEERSKCIMCNESFPETVGANADNPAEIKPVHYKCSMPDPNKKGQLYFDGYRVFRRA
jgi:hypothetical protein